MVEPAKPLVPLPPEHRPFAASYPTLYGFYGAGFESLKAFIPYFKYIDSEERERFTKLSTNAQTRELLLQDLETVALLGAGPIIKGSTPIIARFLPKTYKAFRFLTTPIKEIPRLAKTPAKELATQKLTQIAEQTTLEAGIKTIAKTKPTEPEGYALAVEEMYNEASQASLELQKRTAPHIYKSLKHGIVDVAGNTKKALMKAGPEGKKAVMRHDLIAGARSKALQELDDVSNKIFGGLSKREEEILNRIIQSRRTIEIESYKIIEHPKGLGVEAHQEWLNSLPGNVYKKLNPRADIYFQTMNQQLDKLLAAGIINETAYEALSKHVYSPRRFLQHIDPEKTYKFGTRTISVPDSGIKALAEGSQGLLEKDARLLLSQVILRTEQRVFKNRANQTLYELALKKPDNGVVQIAKVAKTTKTGKLIYQKAPVGYEKISVMVEGTPRQLIMPTQMTQEWVMRDPAINPQLANIISWLSGSKVLKPMATGLNPAFALTNFPRDILHVWITTQEYSPHMPVFAAQIARDLLQELPSSMFRRGSYASYIADGGGMEFLTHQGRILPQKGVAGELQKVFGYLGETSEILTRLALRRRAIRNGISFDEATQIARNYLDFSQGGSWAKAVDTGVPYLNAGIQGTRGIVRATAEHPANTIYKFAQIGTLTTGVYLANKFNCPECWEQVSDREKVNNWIICTNNSFRDKDGNKKFIYYKIAKDQGQRLLCTLFEGLTAKYMGEEVDVDQLTQAAQDALPLIPTQDLPPTFDAILGYMANKDFWRNKDIWRGPEVKPEEEYTRYTHPGIVGFARPLGLSPQRLRYALSQVFTSGNIYTSLTGYTWNQLTNQLPEREKEKVAEEIFLDQPFIRRIANYTDPWWQHQQSLKEAKLQAQTERYVQTRAFDEISQRYYDGEVSIQEIKDFLKKQEPQDKIRLLRRHQRRKRLQDLPERRWWLNLAELNPETRATVYWNRWREADEKEKKMLERHLRIVPGILTTRFMRRFKQLSAKARE